jgi:hypothetical protein
VGSGGWYDPARAVGTARPGWNHSPLPTQLQLVSIFTVNILI